MINSNEKGLAVVTGASSGIGAVYADRLAALGHPLLIIARRANRIGILATQLQEQYNIDVETLALDLSSADDLLSLEKRLESDNVEIVVNNAGGGGLGPLSSTDADKMDSGSAKHYCCDSAIPGCAQWLSSTRQGHAD